jgi:hypothetical protein
MAETEFSLARRSLSEGGKDEASKKAETRKELKL